MADGRRQMSLYLFSSPAPMPSLPPSCSASFHSYKRMQWGSLPVVFIDTGHRCRDTCTHIPPPPPAVLRHYPIPTFLSTLFLRCSRIYGKHNPHSVGWVNTPRALSFWDSELFSAILWYVWWVSPRWCLDKWAEILPSVRQGHTSLVKHTAIIDQKQR